MTRNTQQSAAFATMLVASLFAMSGLGAQQPRPGEVKITEEKPGLAAKAKVSGDSARKVALARIPNGQITKGELEEEDGKLIYSFDIKVAGKKGISEVHVDARSGAVIKTEHEDDDAPAKPAAKTPAKP